METRAVPLRDPSEGRLVQLALTRDISARRQAEREIDTAREQAFSAALETARLLSKRQFDATIIYVAFSAEEQGLWGAELLADGDGDFHLLA